MENRIIDHVEPTKGMLEMPFWHDNITPDEYDDERFYFFNHFKDYTDGKYIPLWKQKKTLAEAVKEEFLQTKTFEEYTQNKEKFKGLDFSDSEIREHMRKIDTRILDSGFHDGVIYEVKKYKND